MSQQTLMVLAQMVQAFTEEGWSGTFPFLDVDFEFHEPPEQPGATVFRGHDEAREGWARWSETWVEQKSEIQGFDELPDGRILVFSHERMRGRDDIEIEQDSWSLFTFKGDKILRWESYWSRSNALAAAGLPE
jgi:ketosteroid isomerase-like protein